MRAVGGSRLDVRVLVTTGGVLAACGGAAGQDRLDSPAVIARVGAYVEAYFAAVRTVTAREHVILQPLDSRLRPNGSRRTLVYDVRLEWATDAGVVAPPRVHRHLVEIDGRRVSDDSAAACLAPESGDPLAFLLPQARKAYTFGPVRRVGRDPVLLAIDYEPAGRGRPSLTWYGDCGVFDLPGRIEGRVFVEPGTFAVRRLESRLMGPVDVPVPESQRPAGWDPSITVERIDGRVEYEPVAFADPDEVLLLPKTLERLSVVRTPDPRRLRATQRFSDYRRFHTAIRIVP